MLYVSIYYSLIRLSTDITKRPWSRAFGVWYYYMINWDLFCAVIIICHWYSSNKTNMMGGKKKTRYKLHISESSSRIRIDSIFVFFSWSKDIDIQLLYATIGSSMPFLHAIICSWSRNCLPFRSTWVHPRFLAGFVLLDLELYMYVL
jgi:hypothetical protein